MLFNLLFHPQTVSENTTIKIRHVYSYNIGRELPDDFLLYIPDTIHPQKQTPYDLFTREISWDKTK